MNDYFTYGKLEKIVAKKNKKKYNDDFIIFRIDECYPKQKIDIKDDKMIKDVARQGWTINLARHPKVKGGYVVYNCKIIKKFRIIWHIPTRIRPKIGRWKTHESLVIEFVNNDEWVNQLIAFNKHTYKNPVRYGDLSLLEDYKKEMKNTYKYLKKSVWQLDKYYMSPQMHKRKVKYPRVPMSKRPTRKH